LILIDEKDSYDVSDSLLRLLPAFPTGGIGFGTKRPPQPTIKVQSLDFVLAIHTDTTANDGGCLSP